MKLLILGAGGQGRVCKETAEAMHCFEAVDFLDDDSPLAIGRMDTLEMQRSQYDAAFVGIGNHQLRLTLLERAKTAGYILPVLVHPTAYVAQDVTIGAGTIIEPHAMVNREAIVGQGCIISIGAIVDHNATLCDGVHANAGAICKAGSRVERCVKLEAGQVVKGY